MLDAEVCEIRVRRHADLRAEGATEMELVEARVRCEIVERDRFCEPLPEVRHRASHRTRVLGARIAEPREGGHGLRERDLDWTSGLEGAAAPRAPVWLDDEGSLARGAMMLVYDPELDRAGSGGTFN